jgi:hypothetical protein
MGGFLAAAFPLTLHATMHAVAIQTSGEGVGGRIIGNRLELGWQNSDQALERLDS